jgi:hypothetical protein
MMRTLLVLAAALSVVTMSGCCWPLHEGRRGGRGYGYRDDSYRSDRPVPARPYGGRDRDHDHDHDR